MTSGTRARPAAGGDRRRTARARTADGMRTALAPVASGLLDAAQASASRSRAAADADARAELARARAEAARILADARTDGTRAAARAGARQLIDARREAREHVLAARRGAFEALRESAIDALAAEASSPGGRWVVERLAELVGARLGVTASVLGDGEASLRAVAELGNRRAVLGLEELVDQALTSMVTEIEALWA